jgi:glutamate synthase (NADPH) large chain
LGQTGRNFAAGMSGGEAYVYDADGTFAQRCNYEMVEAEKLVDPTEIAEVEAMIRRHYEYTDSPVAKQMLEQWASTVAQFTKVMPRDYKRVMDAYAEVTAQGLSGDDAMMAAFELNKNDTARVGGN